MKPHPGSHFSITIIKGLYLDIAIRKPKFYFYRHTKKRLAADLINKLFQLQLLSSKQSLVFTRIYEDAVSHAPFTKDDAERLLKSHKGYQEFVQYEKTMQELLRLRLVNALNDLNEAINDHNNTNKEKSVQKDNNDAIANINGRLKAFENALRNRNSNNNNNINGNGNDNGDSTSNGDDNSSVI